MQGQTNPFKVYDGVAGNFLQEISKGLLPLLWLLSKPKPYENPQVNINEYFRVFSASFMKIVMKDLLLEKFGIRRIFCMRFMCILASVVCVYLRCVPGHSSLCSSTLAWSMCFS